jgi:hypothetical protein
MYHKWLKQDSDAFWKAYITGSDIQSITKQCLRQRTSNPLLGSTLTSNFAIATNLKTPWPILIPGARTVSLRFLSLLYGNLSFGLVVPHSTNTLICHDWNTDFSCLYQIFVRVFLTLLLMYIAPDKLSVRSCLAPAPAPTSSTPTSCAEVHGLPWFRTDLESSQSQML